MAMLGTTLDAARAHFGWGAIADFVRHLPPGSATWRALNPEAAAFCSPLSLATISADVFDELALTRYTVAKLFSPVAPKKPRPYSRPWDTSGDRHFGSGAIPVSEFDAWYYGEQ